MKFSSLKKAIKELNDAGILDNKIDMSINRKKKELTEDFCTAIEAIDEADKVDEIPDFAFNFYNDNFVEEDETKNEIGENEMENEVKEDEKVIDIDKKKVMQEEPTVAEDEKPKSKKEKPEKKKEKAKLSIYGHKLGTQAAKIDELLEGGTTMENAMEVIGVKKSRIMSHISHLQKNRKLTVEINDNIYKVKK